MPSVMTSELVESLLHFVVSESARCCFPGRDDVEPGKSLDSIVAEISKENSEIGHALADFIDAYRNWFAMCVEIEKDGKEGALDEREHSRYLHLIERRDTTRTNLLGVLRANGRR